MSASNYTDSGVAHRKLGADRLITPLSVQSHSRTRWGSAAIYDTRIAHVRHTPLRNAFSYRSYAWLVDLDDLPRPPRSLRALAQFRAEDHLGEPDRTLRQNVDALLALHGVDLSGGRILMLANARVLGYVFNPLSVFWCHHADGSLRLRGRRGAQHLRRAARLPAVPGRPASSSSSPRSSTSRRSIRSTAAT